MAIGRQRKLSSAAGLAPAGEPRPEISERILRHFGANAQAMDSAEGIARFWLNEDRGEVERCLEDLAARGVLLKRVIAGSGFFSLPRRADGDGFTVAAESAPAASLPAADPGRILVVDDDPAVLRLLCETLRQCGHQVTPAGDGGSAIELCRGSQHDVIIADLLMPGISGLETLRVLKQLDPSVEVILVTGRSSLDTAVEALRAGAYDFVAKPIPDLGQLTRTVARALEKRRLSLDNLALVENLKTRNLELGVTVSRMSAVSDLGRTPSTLLEVGELYDSVSRVVARQLNASRVSLLMAGPDDDTMDLVASVGIPEHQGTRQRVRIGEGIAGKVAATCAPFLAADIQETELRHLAVSSRYRTPSCIVVPLIVSHPSQRQSRQIGVIAASDKHSGEPFTQQDLDFLSALSAQVSVTLEQARLVREMEDGYLGALLTLIQACEEARPGTGKHSRRVVDLAAATARELRLPEGRVQLLLKAASLHEIGRLASSAASAPEGRETAAGGALRHWSSQDVVATNQILARIPTLREVREIILYSADGQDAAAPPFEVMRAPVPVESRILAVCEEFSRFEARAGSGRAATARALSALRSEPGHRHAPDVVKALEQALEREEGA